MCIHNLNGISYPHAFSWCSCGSLIIFFFLCLRKKGFRVQSFGTGNQVKLPGPSPDKPNVYDFSVTYDEMYKDLWRKDPDLYPYFFLLHYLDLGCKNLSHKN